MQRSVYLDSTIPSYLFDERTGIQTYVEVTKKMVGGRAAAF